MTRGEVWWHEPPHKKARPVLILTRDELSENIFDVIAVPTTTKIRGTPTEIQIGEGDGMPSDCVLVLANTFSAEKVYLTQHITTLDAVRMSEVCRMLAWTAGC